MHTYWSTKVSIVETTAFQVVTYGDSQDWKDYGASDIVKRCTKSENLGSIILLHNGAKYTAEALEEVILTLLEEGYELVPVSELMYQKKYVVDSMGRQVVK